MPVVGYSVNDFYYENPAYCGVKDASGKYPSENKDINNVTDDTIDDTSNQCIMNEYLAKKVKGIDNGLTTNTSRYKFTLSMYNRELLRTINYIAGIGMLVAYIYVNKQ